jgi:hypothetical protein
MSSLLTNLDEGGYRVNIASGGFSSALTGWIFLDRPHSLAQLQNFTCDYVALRGLAAVDTFYYSDPTNGQRVILPNRFRFLWTSDPV